MSEDRTETTREERIRQLAQQLVATWAELLALTGGQMDEVIDDDTRHLVRDLAEYKRAEEERARLIAILEASPDMVSFSNMKGEVIYFNRAAREILGIPLGAELHGFPIPKGHPAWAYEILQKEAIPTAMAKGYWHGETAVLSHDGREIPVSQVVMLHRAPDGTPAYLSTVARDISAQKHAQAELARIAAILEATPDIVSSATMDGQIIYYNRAGRRLLGIPDNVDVRTLRIPNMHPDWARELVLNVGIPAAIRDGIWQGETAVRTFDGRDIPLSQVIISHEVGPRGERLLSTIARDITEQKRAQAERERLLEETRRQRVFLEQLVAEAPVGIAVVSGPDHRYELVNPRFQKTLGATDRAVPGNSIGETFPAMAAQAVQQWVEAVYETGETVSVREYEIVGSSGEPTYWNLDHVPLCNAAGAVERVLILANEVTEQVRARRDLERLAAEIKMHSQELEQRVAQRTAELRASEARFRAIFEEAAIGIALTDIHGRQVDSNPALQQLLGYSASEMRRMTFADLTHPDDVQRDWELYRELVAGKRRFYTMQKRYIHKDGHTIWANLVVSLVQGVCRGQDRFAIRMVEDITEQKQMQNALVQAEKLAAAGKLAASFAHEINNPLQSVIGCLSLAEETLMEGGDASRYMRMAREELRRVARIVGELRDMHRQVRLEERKPTNINVLVEQILTLSMKKCRDAGIHVVWEGAEDLPPLMVVPDRIRQVFLNVLLNAVDAMPEGGDLEIKARRTTDPEGVSISFRDTGIGMSSEAQQHLFTAFYSTKPNGLGLGLYLTKRIVDEHGGHIEVESKLGEGTTLTIWLPS